MKTDIWQSKLVNILKLLPMAARFELASVLVLGDIKVKNIRAALRSAVSDYTAILPRTAEVSSSADRVPGKAPEGASISFFYESRNGNTSLRTVVPIRIYQHTRKNGVATWYLEAWCLYNNDYRTYYLNRVNLHKNDVEKALCE